MKKTCFKCGEVKPLGDYYKHKKMLDGHLNKCKECTKKDVNKHREENIDKIREYDRNRPNKAERSKKASEYHKTERGKEVRRKSTKKYRLNSIKYEAHTDLSNALKRGKIIKPSNCESCGVECNPHGHHDDYYKTLDVRWLCVKCHTDFHNHVRNKERELLKLGIVKSVDSIKLIKEVAESYWSN